MKSLQFEQIHSRRATIKEAYKRTCYWLVDHPGYNTWLDPAQYPRHRGFFWISGKPGAGKSTLMKFILKRAESMQSVNTATASFFFNARGHELEKVCGRHVPLAAATAIPKLS